MSPAASMCAAAEAAFFASTLEGLVVAPLLGRLGVVAATQGGTTGFTLFTLTHKAHAGEKVMLGAEVYQHFFTEEPESEMAWVPEIDLMADSTGCSP